MSKKNNVRYGNDKTIRYNQDDRTVVKAHTQGDWTNPAMQQLTQQSQKAGLLVKTNNGKKLYRMLPSLDAWKGDGEDHINISWQGLTDLGNQLEFGYRHRLGLNHSLFLKFETIEGFRAWLRSNPTVDRFRYINGRELREIARSVKNRYIPHLKAIVMDAAYQLVKGNKNLYNLMYNNDLPFDCYNVTNYVKSRNRDHEWIIEGYTIIRDAIQAQVEPDFSSLADFKTNDIYEAVRPVITDEQIVLDKKIAERLRSKRKNQNMVPFVKPELNPKTEVKSRKPNKKSGFTFKENCGYSRLFPIVTTENYPYLLSAFERKIHINGLEITTAPLRAKQLLHNEPRDHIDLIKVSDMEELSKMGIQNENDIIIPGPVYENSFNAAYTTNNILGLDSLVFNTSGGPNNDAFMMSLATGLKFVNKNFDRPGDVQRVTKTHEVVTVKRLLLLFKPLAYLHAANSEEKNLFIKELVLNNPDHKYGIFLVYVKFDLNTFLGTMNLSGSVKLVGSSDSGYDNRQRKDYYFDEYSEFNTCKDLEAMARHECLSLMLYGDDSLKGDGNLKGCVVGFTINLFRGSLGLDIKLDPAVLDKASVELKDKLKDVVEELDSHNDEVDSKSIMTVDLDEAISTRENSSTDTDNLDFEIAK